LHEDGVDLLEADGPGLVADGFDQRSDAEVLDGPEASLGKAEDEVDGIFAEGGMGQAGEVELLVDVAGEGGVGEEVELGGVSDAALEVELGPELEGGVEGGLADEDEVVVLGEVLEHEAEFVEGFDGQEVGVVDDRDDGPAPAVLGAGFGDEAVRAVTGGPAGGLTTLRLGSGAQAIMPGWAQTFAFRVLPYPLPDAALPGAVAALPGG
jgi:hypothetical protein